MLCERHHKIVDNDTEKYSVKYLTSLKAIHQDKFVDKKFDITNNTADKLVQKVVFGVTIQPVFNKFTPKSPKGT